MRRIMAPLKRSATPHKIVPPTYDGMPFPRGGAATPLSLMGSGPRSYTSSRPPSTEPLSRPQSTEPYMYGHRPMSTSPEPPFFYSRPQSTEPPQWAD